MGAINAVAIAGVRGAAGADAVATSVSIAIADRGGGNDSENWANLCRPCCRASCTHGDGTQTDVADIFAASVTTSATANEPRKSPKPNCHHYDDSDDPVLANAHDVFELWFP